MRRQEYGTVLFAVCLPGAAREGISASQEEST